MLDLTFLQTDEQKALAAHEQAVDNALNARRAAYVAESDPLRNELIYDAIAAGREVDLKPWLAKVKEIKERFPLPPVAPE